MNIQCLILACGNTLRSDDGIGPWLAAWAEERFAGDPRVTIISRQQWTPDLAAEIADAATVLFIDCSVASDPGTVKLADVDPDGNKQGLATHHQTPSQLLALANELFGATPHAKLLTIGAASLELGERFSAAAQDSLPRACALLAQAVEEACSQKT